MRVRSRRYSSSDTWDDERSGLVLQTSPRRLHNGRAALVVSIFLVAFAATTARIFVWPPLPPLPDRSDAIVELGGPGDRDAVTLALANEHRAPVVIQSTVPQDAVTDTCLPAVEGVEVRCFHADPPTTRGEARYIGEEGEARNWKSVIVVTTPDHAWRARLRVERCFSGRVYVQTSPLPRWDWFRQIPYQWAATIKAVLFERDC